MTRWKPNVTVATVVERENHLGEKEYLLVHEHRDSKDVYNQPAGHLDEGEGLIAAAKRETLEETGWEVEITGLIGIYRFIAPNGITYMRHAFAAKTKHHFTEQTLDDGIIGIKWLSYPEIQKKSTELRSSMVLRTIEDHRKGEFYPLSLIHDIY